jgi:hypothetical protein
MKRERPTQRTHQGTRKETRQYWKGTHTYEAGAWRDDETTGIADCGLRIADLGKGIGKEGRLSKFDIANPDARERSRLLRLLGLINYRFLTGNKFYIEVGGIVYKTLYGGYWRSVFTGVEHYLLKCQAVSGSIWTEGSIEVDLVDLPIAHTQEGWTAQGHSVMFMLNRDQ